MSDIDERNREEISLLLPWYANGTLEGYERDLVEEALQTDKALAAEYDLIVEDQLATLDLATAAEVPESMSLRFNSALERKLAEQPVADQQAQGQPGFLDQTSAFLAQLFAGPRLALVAATAIVIIAVQGGALVSILSNGVGTGPQFQTANETAPAPVRGIEVLVGFAPNANQASITAFLTKEKAVIVDGPLAGGLYRLRFQPGDDRSDDQSIVERLKSETSLFMLVLPGG